MYQAVGDNKDELAQRLEETAKKLLAVERTVAHGLPKASEEAMENLKSYVVFPALKGYHMEYITIQVLEKEMKDLKDLADKSLAIQILDHEAYGSRIQQIFQRVKEATMTFFVRTIMFILVPSSKWRSASSKRRVRYVKIPR